MEKRKKMRVRIQIPAPGKDCGALVTDADTGAELPCSSLDIHIDVKTMLPTLKLELITDDRSHVVDAICETLSGEVG